MEVLRLCRSSLTHSSVGRIVVAPSGPVSVTGSLTPWLIIPVPSLPQFQAKAACSACAKAQFHLRADGVYVLQYRLSGSTAPTHCLRMVSTRAQR
jgi:hypothetical protein